MFIIIKNTCHNYECITKRDCPGRFNKCFQMFCSDTTKQPFCTDHDDCPRKTHRCCWGKCYKIGQQVYLLFMSGQMFC